MRLIQGALEAADPERLVRVALRIEGGRLIIEAGERFPIEGGNQFPITSGDYDLSSVDHIFILGAGKAGGPMALAAESVLGDHIAGGIVVVKDGCGVDGLRRVQLREVAHPIPDERAALAARELLQLAESASERDLVICLVSGGGSVLMALPAPGMSMDDLRLTSKALFMSGAAIEEVNAVRKHLTMASAGRVAAAAYPAGVATLIISDVIGDSLDVIASGPTVPDSSTFATALAVIDRFGLREKIAPAALGRLEAGVAGKVEETPKPGARVFTRVQNHILASNSTAVDAAAESSRAFCRGREGFTDEKAAPPASVHRLKKPIVGEARHAAEEMVAEALREWEIRSGHAAAGKNAGAPAVAAKPFCVIAGGETTVTVTGHGLGGRAQEFALAAALTIEELSGVLVFAFGTDGTDGPTDAAGAIADGSTAARARALGLDPGRHLREHDAYPLFQALGDLIITGPTGTNVNDIYGVIIG